MDSFVVKCTHEASQRTKNRVREHGPIFHFRDIGFPVCGNGQKCILLKAKDTDWLGWLPVDELKFWGIS